MSLLLRQAQDEVTDPSLEEILIQMQQVMEQLQYQLTSADKCVVLLQYYFNCSNAIEDRNLCTALKYMAFQTRQITINTFD